MISMLWSVVAVVMTSMIGPSTPGVDVRSSLRVDGPALVEFANAVSIDPGDVRGRFRALVATTVPTATPNFGGAEVLSAEMSSLFHNSVPFGNCGRLNTIAASYFSFTNGVPFRFRSGVGHVFTEVKFADVWRIVDLYAREDLLRPEGDPPFYRLGELLFDPVTGERTRAYQSIPNPAHRSYYAEVQAPDTQIYRCTVWRQPRFELEAGEVLTLGPSELSGWSLSGSGSLPGVRVAEPPISFPDTHLSEAILRKPLRTSGFGHAHEYPFLIQDVSLAMGAGANVGIGPLDPLLAFDAVEVLPRAPEWATPLSSLPSVSPAESPTKTLAATTHPKWYEGWIVETGRVETSPWDVVISSVNGEYTELARPTGHVNTSDRPEHIWIPFLYSTDTPTRHGDGKPVGSLIANADRVNLYARNREIQYADLFFTVAPGESLDLHLQVFPDKRLRILTLGEPTNISDIISPQNPVCAVTIDASRVPEPWRDVLLLELKFLVNPLLEPVVREAGSDPNAEATAPKDQ